MLTKPYLLLLLSLFIGSAFAAPIRQTTPTSDFVDNHDGTVTHKITGLMWMRCAMGQTWTGSVCTGTATTYTYDAAKKLSYDFAGNSDWRLPNIAELQTIVERGTINPAINSEVFDNTPTWAFWSSSPNVASASYAWDVDFFSGYVSNYYRSYVFAVRLVRASQSLVISEATRMAEFSYYANGTVLHKRTGLMWQRCAVGQAWTGSTCTGTAGKYTFDAAQKLTSRLAGYSDWRMPAVNELASIVSYDRMLPTLNKIPFPNSAIDVFWSASPYVGRSGYAWYVYFRYGGIGSLNWESAFAVRLVRTSPSWVMGLNTSDLTVKLKTSKHQVSIKQPLKYTATVNNTGLDTAKAASVVFYLKMNDITFDHLPADCQVSSTYIECKLGDLPVNASASRTIAISYTKLGGIGANALALTNSIESNYDNNLSHVAITVLP
ncbi:MAG: DUF1566 domain-containing protein [Methylovulum sp.]|nr:DUF1566 domain-containing protein [Methylovulum sp.]MCF7998361.1 DUF1566 domain-containing protein [Methylovulum sp.]